MKHAHNGAEFMKLWAESCFLAIEAQMIIAMRLAGMAGFWNVTKAENTLMYSEKLAAAKAAALAAATAAAMGSTPAGVTLAAMKPIRRKTTANARRLGKRGFKV